MTVKVQARGSPPRRSPRHQKPSSVAGRRPWKIVNPSGARWAQSYDTPAKAWMHILSAHGMQALEGAQSMLVKRGWRVEKNDA